MKKCSFYLWNKINLIPWSTPNTQNFWPFRPIKFLEKGWEKKDVSFKSPLQKIKLLIETSTEKSWLLQVWRTLSLKIKLNRSRYHFLALLANQFLDASNCMNYLAIKSFLRVGKCPLLPWWSECGHWISRKVVIFSGKFENFCTLQPFRSLRFPVWETFSNVVLSNDDLNLWSSRSTPGCKNFHRLFQIDFDYQDKPKSLIYGTIAYAFCVARKQTQQLTFPCVFTSAQKKSSGTLLKKMVFQRGNFENSG